MNFINKHKTGLIIGGIVLAFILLVVGMFASTNNKAVFLEEQINGAQANINVAEKRRVDLVYNLVDAAIGLHTSCKPVLAEKSCMSRLMVTLLQG